METRYGEATIARPATADQAAKKSIRLHAIEVREREQSVVAGGEPIHRRPLTTHWMESVEDALQAADWYCQRWQIEQLFRTLKRQGSNIESGRVEQGESSMKLASLAAQAVVPRLQPAMARDGDPERPATDVLDDEEIEVLEKLQPQLEGRTEKRKNPGQKRKLAWAGWMIARLGGWNGYASEANPVQSPCLKVNNVSPQWRRAGNLQICAHGIARRRRGRHNGQHSLQPCS